jgi:hypothetical protein
MLDFRGALSRSAQQFKTILEPELQQILKGKFEVVEGVTVDQLAKLLDALAGIDVWHIDKIKGIRGIALRIQTGKYWKTFTVRNKRESGAKTEYEKRKYAIEHGYLYPYLTVQAYISPEGKLKGFAIARTVDIMSAIDAGFSGTRHTGEKQVGQAEFFWISWKTLAELGYTIVTKEYPEIELTECF